MNILTHPLADAETLSAVDYYETSSPGTGLRFRSELRERLQFLAKDPRISRWAAFQVIGD